MNLSWFRKIMNSSWFRKVQGFILVVFSLIVGYVLFAVTLSVPEIANVSIPLSITSFGALVSILLKGVYDKHQVEKAGDAIRSAMFWELCRNYVILLKKKVSLVSLRTWDLFSNYGPWNHFEKSGIKAIIKAYSTLSFYNYEISRTSLPILIIEKLREDINENETEPTEGSVTSSERKSSVTQEADSNENWARRKQENARRAITTALVDGWPNESKQINWMKVSAALGFDTDKDLTKSAESDFNNLTNAL